MIPLRNFALPWSTWTVSSDFPGHYRQNMTFCSVEGIRSFKIPPEREEYLVPADSSIANLAIDPQLQPEGTTGRKDVTMKSNMRMFPPPLFSRQNLPLNYKYVLVYSRGLLLMILQLQSQSCIIADHGDQRRDRRRASTTHQPDALERSCLSEHHLRRTQCRSFISYCIAIYSTTKL
jgi:hypothetical protein